MGQSPVKIGQELDHGVPSESEKSHSSRIKSPEVIVMKQNLNGGQKENLIMLNKNSITFARNHQQTVNKTYEVAKLN